MQNKGLAFTCSSVAGGLWLWVAGIFFLGGGEPAGKTAILFVAVFWAVLPALTLLSTIPALILLEIWNLFPKSPKTVSAFTIFSAISPELFYAFTNSTVDIAQSIQDCWIFSVLFGGMAFLISSISRKEPMATVD
jgi:hypothetical protein